MSVCMATLWNGWMIESISSLKNGKEQQRAIESPECFFFLYNLRISNKIFTSKSKHEEWSHFQREVKSNDWKLMANKLDNSLMFFNQIGSYSILMMNKYVRYINSGVSKFYSETIRRWHMSRHLDLNSTHEMDFRTLENLYSLWTSFEFWTPSSLVTNQKHYHCHRDFTWSELLRASCE